jgi:hypothetical protein
MPGHTPDSDDALLATAHAAAQTARVDWHETEIDGLWIHTTLYGTARLVVLDRGGDAPLLTSVTLRALDSTATDQSDVQQATSTCHGFTLDDAKHAALVDAHLLLFASSPDIAADYYAAQHRAES